MPENIETGNDGDAVSFDPDNASFNIDLVGALQSIGNDDGAGL